MYIKHLVSLLCILLSSNLSFSSPLNSTQENGTKDKLVFLGGVDGKNYYYDTTVSLDWAAAKAYCAANGLKLASIKSSVQFQFLDQSFSSAFVGHHWIAGRESRKLGMFAWDDEPNTPLPSTLADRLDTHLDPAYLICLMIDPLPVSRIEMDECSEPHSVLCEN